MYRILYVDDEPGLLEIGKLFLDSTGEFDVSTLTSAEKALESPEILLFDAIISDYQMPGMDGISFLKNIRKRTKDVPFVLFTGRGREEVVIEAINSGADFYLQKGGQPTAQFAELAHKIRIAIERRRAIDSVKDSEQRLTDIIDFLPDATFAIDTTGRVIAWNRAMEQMTGTPAEDIRGKGNYEDGMAFYGERRPMLADLLLNPDFSFEEKTYTNVRRAGTGITAEGPVQIRGNSLRYLWGIAGRLFDKEGKCTGSIESIRDITERKEAEKELQAAYEQIAAAEEELRGQYEELAAGDLKLKEREAQLWAIFKEAPHAIAISDSATGKYLSVNTLFEQGSGLAASEILGKTSAEIGFVPPEEHELLLKEFIREGGIRQKPLTAKMWDGRKADILFTAVPIVLSTRTIVLTMVVDITDMKRIEDALRKQEQILNDAFASIKDGISLLDKTMTVIRVNKTMEEWYSHEMPLIGRKCWEVYHGRAGPCDICPTLHTLKEGKPAKERVPLVDAGEVTGWLDLYSYPVIDSATGEMTGVIEYVRNVTEETKAQRDLELANKKLNLLSSTTRHDILNTLTGLQGLVDKAASLSTSGECTHLLSQIRDRAGIIRQQIDFTGRYQEVGVHAPLWQDVNVLLSRILPATPRTKAGIVNDCDNVEIFSDPLLEKVLYNLVNNALKYGGPDLTTVHITSDLSAPELIIAVADDGVGIAAGDKDHLFQREVGQKTGSGLFLAREILSITGITIRETGTPGKGARFEILVPPEAWRKKRQ
ncbi:multi-sensor signal transduction histidine kinase [Methanoregula boonei 6A8]|jgi:PAS domain S-box-containing protein|uniref:histidine kinase n=1 Tax=Methanoregula boonei (strain DSM 21154 / JCM 14090 / 6A8) TaxID=456442 RepID=A7I5B1_METB6|nr:PAS domain S-box protein [Methanoregula boonei]ABS54922.1 multi-sensor signal transduction histidine kinase [Methanoregula boonei 6A8]